MNSSTVSLLCPGRDSGVPVRLDRPLRLTDLPTPALVIDEPALMRNLSRMNEHLVSFGKRARPHTKTHKCPELARRQMAAGAVGVCCAKVSEAEVMWAGGVDRLLVTSPIVSEDKVDRFVTLCQRATRETGSRRGTELAIVVDSVLGRDRLATAAEQRGVVVDVLIDLDAGTHRTGVAMGEAAAIFAGEVQQRPSLRFAGLQAYAGHLQHVHGFAERRNRALAAWAEAVATRERILERNLPVPVLTGSGTGTFDIDVEVPEISDLQVGSYVFMDLEYGALESRAVGGQDPGVPGETFGSFETALFVLATAISQPVSDRITIDAGFKAFSTDSVRPELLDFSGVRYHWGGDEHGILELSAPSRPIVLGDKLRLAVPHCDPTVNLYDGFWVCRGESVEQWWPISARGCSQ